MGTFSYRFDLEDLTETANQVKEIFLSKMLKEKIITQQQHDDMMCHSIVMCKKSMLGSIWNRFWKKDEKLINIFVVKVLEKTDSEKENDNKEGKAG